MQSDQSKHRIFKLYLRRVNQPITILAIESSCDETAASVIVDGKILSNFIANQTVHEKYGGVVPELASRAHMENIVPVVDAALKKAFPELTRVEQLAQLNAIAFTQAPGLIGSLLVGAQFAKSLALALNIPLIAVHHMQAHVLANLVKKLKKAMKETGIEEVCIAGGVSANSGLRKGMEQLGKDTHSAIFLPKFEYCTDNAAMIAITAHFKYIAGSFEPMTTSASARSSWA